MRALSAETRNTTTPNGVGPRESARGRTGNGRRRENVKSRGRGEERSQREDVDHRAFYADERSAA